MNKPSENQNELGIMYHGLRGSGKKMVLEDLEALGLSKNNLYYWLRDVRKFPKMPGSMQDVLIAHLPDSKSLFGRERITSLPNFPKQKSNP